MNVLLAFSVSFRFKGSDGQIYSKYLSNGIWSPWVTMTTSLAYGNSQLDILDGIAAATRPDGRLEVFATSRSGYIQRHLEDVATPTFNSVYSFPVGAGGSDIVFGASAPTLTRNADGRLELSTGNKAQAG